jgi:predicted DNA-binding transcriptional regulator YafY
MRTRLERLLGIEDEIGAGRYPSLEKLCQIFSVKQRTVYEDIRILRERLGLDIQFDRVRNGYFNATPKHRLPAFDLSIEEFSFLILGGELLCSSMGAAFKPIVQHTLNKIYDRLTVRSGVAFDEVVSIARCELKSTHYIKPDALRDFFEACLEKRSMEVSYYDAAGETKDNVVSAMHLLELGQQWYLLVYFPEVHDLGLISLHQIKRYQISNNRIDVPKFDVASWISRHA